MKRTYSKSVEGWNKLYNKYLAEYDRKQAALGKRGLRIKETKYSLAEYRSEYTALKNDFAEKKVKTPRINVELVKSQLYTWSTAQANAFRQGLLKKGLSEKEIPTIEELRIQGKSALDKYVNRIEKAHPDWSSEQVGDLVSENIYGSP